MLNSVKYELDLWNQIQILVVPAQLVCQIRR